MTYIRTASPKTIAISSSPMPVLAKFTLATHPHLSTRTRTHRHTGAQNNEYNSTVNTGNARATAGYINTYIHKVIKNSPVTHRGFMLHTYIHKAMNKVPLSTQAG